MAKWKELPEGPIYVPMAQMMSEQLTVQQLLRVADLALNRLDLRAVGGDLHVGLHVAIAEADRVLEGGHGVLGHVARAAAVRERNRPRPVEVRMGTGLHRLKYRRPA